MYRELELKYDKLYKEIYHQRHQLLQGKIQPPADLIADYDLRAKELDDEDFKKIEVNPCDVKEIQNTPLGVPGFWLLRAAQGDPRLTKIWLDRTPATYCGVIGTPVHRDLHDAVSPGACLTSDWMDLRDKRTIWSDPTDWQRNIKGGLQNYTYRHFDQGDAVLIRKFLE